MADTTFRSGKIVALSKFPNENTPSKKGEEGDAENLNLQATITLGNGGPPLLKNAGPPANYAPLTLTSNPHTPEPVFNKEDEEEGGLSSFLDALQKGDCENDEATPSLFDGKSHAAFVEQLFNERDQESVMAQSKKEQMITPEVRVSCSQEHGKLVSDVTRIADDSKIPLEDVTTASQFSPEVVQKIDEITEGVNNKSAVEMDTENLQYSRSNHSACSTFGLQNMRAQHQSLTNTEKVPKTTLKRTFCCPNIGNFPSTSLLTNLVVSSKMLQAFTQLEHPGLNATSAQAFIRLVNDLREGRLSMDLEVARHLLRTLDRTTEGVATSWKEKSAPTFKLRSCQDLCCTRLS